MRALLLLLIAWQTTNPLAPFLPKPPQFINVSTSTSATTVKPGSKLLLFVDVVPKPGIHVYAPGAKDYMPIALTVAAQPKVRLGKLVYPKSETMTFENERIPVFQQPFRMIEEVTLGAVPVGTSLAIGGTITYQACDDKVCYKPETVPVTWMVAVK